MITIRRAAERGHVRMGWLDTQHSFSFGHYYDLDHMGFGPLRVINEDRIDAGAGFPPHGHADMEIITYMLDGALEHKDSLGTGSVIRRGEVQRMSAGTGIRHSEYNASKTDPAHLLQIWLLPDEQGVAPGYEQKEFSLEPGGGLRLVASKDGRDGSLSMIASTDLYSITLRGGEVLSHQLAAGRLGWLQMVSGSVSLNGEALSAGDGAAVEDVATLEIAADEDAELLLFDMAA